METETLPPALAGQVERGVRPQSVALKPCPFCGKHNTLTLTTAQELAEQDSNYDGEFWEHSDSWAVMCDAHRPGGPGGCGASGGFFGAEADAVAAWNKRAPKRPPLAPQPPGPPGRCASHITAHESE